MNRTFGARVYFQRKKNNWTLKELKEKTDLSEQALNLIERDITKNPSMEAIKRLSTAFNVSTDYLIFGRVKSKFDLEVVDIPSGKIFIEK